MKKRLSIIFLFVFIVGIINGQEQKMIKLLSPDKTIELVVSVKDAIQYSVLVDDKTVLNPSSISMKLGNGKVLGHSAKVIDITRKTVDEEVIPVVKEKFNVIKDNYNELTISFEGNFSVSFRAYNNGIAYRFTTDVDDMIKVISEESVFNFSGSDYVYYPEEESFFSHNERLYLHMQLDTMAAGRLASLPVLIETQGPKILIAESALKDYPGMWVVSSGNNSLKATFPKYALEEKLKPNSDRNMPVTKSANYIAKTEGSRNFPWRILVIAKKDADLVTNQLVYLLGEKQQIKGTSWIKPGKVAWDWWNALNVYGVDFKSGVNTKTYKYYIDFASRFGIEYIILDEGWYKLGNLMEVVPDINMEEIIAYGKKKNVGIILWVVWKTLDDQLEEALNQFEKWGVKGIKVGFYAAR